MRRWADAEHNLPGISVLFDSWAVGVTLGARNWYSRGMRAAWYEKQGPAAEVLVLGEMPDPDPGEGEVRIRVHASGVNPGDVKKRQDAFGIGMSFPRVIPHSDGAGVIDRVGASVSKARVGERVWCFGAQSYRAFGTAAEFVVVPSEQAIGLSEQVSFEQGACWGIAGITAYRAVFAAGAIADKTVLVQGGAGAVGSCAIALARAANARVLATVRSERDRPLAERAGAHVVVCGEGRAADACRDQVLKEAPEGVHHIVEVALGENIRWDEQVLASGGSIAAYATGEAEPRVPFWPLAFKNVEMHWLGSDDFSFEWKARAAVALNEALAAGWPGFEIAERFPLSAIASAHEWLEDRARPGRVVVVV